MSWTNELKDRLLMAYHITRYHSRLAVQALLSRLISGLRTSAKGNSPEITIFISSFNTLKPLELTLASLAKYNKYEAKRFYFGENASSDGSAEFLREFALRHPNVEISFAQPKPHGLWIDQAILTATTPYLIFVDSDILFFPRDLLQDIVDYMEREQDCWLLECDYRPPSPLSEDPEIYCPEPISTWLFCVRTSLKQKIQASFLGRDGEEKGAQGKPRIHYECGAAVLEEMRAKQLRYDVMPWWMRQKFFHFGNLSWFGKFSDHSNRFVKVKLYQMKDIAQRVRDLVN